MANLDQIINHLADATIVEEGGSGIWHYRKWSNGRGECWALLNPTVKTGTSYQGLYYATYTVNVSFPFLFVERPILLTSTNSGTMGILGDITFDATKITSYDMYRAGSGNVGNSLAVYAQGDIAQ